MSDKTYMPSIGQTSFDKANSSLPGHLEGKIEQQILEQFTDLVLPEQIGWWPFSWQVWLVIVSILSIALIIAFVIYYRRRHDRYRRVALNRLHQLVKSADKDLRSATIQKVNELIKNCLNHAQHPKQNFYALYGADWYEYIYKHLPTRQQKKLKTHRTLFQDWQTQSYEESQDNVKDLKNFFEFSAICIKCHTVWKQKHV